MDENGTLTPSEERPQNRWRRERWRRRLGGSVRDNGGGAPDPMGEVQESKRARPAPLDPSAAAVLDQVPALIWRADPAGDYTYFNHAWRRFTGSKDHRSWLELVAPADREAVAAQHEIAFREGEAFEHSYRLRRHTGEYRWLRESGVPLRNAKGRVTGFQGHAIDFTDLKHAEDEWRALEGRTQALAEISPVGIFRTDADGNCLYVNQRWCQMTQMGTQEAKGKGWTRTVHPADRDLFVAEWRRFARVADVFHLQYRLKRDDSTTLCVLGQAKPERDADGRIVGVVGTLTDLTARNSLEQEQLKLSKIESLGVLAGGIAHDFNNQLTPVILNLSHVLEEELPEDVRELLAEAKRAVDEASSLTRQLLTFAKGGDPITKTIALPALLRRSMNFALRGTSVSGELAMDTGLWPVRMDCGQISQVIQNLVINACQAMPDGGKVTIAAENVYGIRHRSLPKKDGRFVHVSVTDTGTGISPENIKKIFDPYFTTKPEGHGLGLASSLSIVRKHQGEMSVISDAAGGGTTFSLYLPASDAQVEEGDEEGEISTGKPRAIPIGNDGHAPRIMIMDDEPLIRTSTRLLLDKLGYHVVEAEDGERALALYKESKANGHPIDMTLMDLTIPGGMGGRDAIAAFRDFDPDCKAIVFSGYSNDRVMANANEYGFVDAVQKPFQPDQLARLINKHLTAA